MTDLITIMRKLESVRVHAYYFDSDGNQLDVSAANEERKPDGYTVYGQTAPVHSEFDIYNFGEFPCLGNEAAHECAIRYFETLGTFADKHGISTQLEWVDDITL